jgi:hypothetical protein
MTVNASDFNVPFEALADRTAHVEARVTTNDATIAAHTAAIADLEDRAPGIAASIVHLCPLVAAFNDSDLFVPLDEGGWLQDDLSAPSLLVIPLYFPTQCKIDRLSIVVDGKLNNAAAAHAGLPATMPTLELLYNAVAPGAPGSTPSRTVVSLGTATDGSASVTNYDALHEIQLTGLAHEVIAGYPYYARIRGEFGANALASYFAVLSMYALLTPV